MNLKNLLDRLLKEGKIRRQDTDINYLNNLLGSAQQNFLSAKYNLKGCFYETAFKSVYDGLLQISRVILLLNGYRPDDGEQHKTTFIIAGAILGKEFKELIEKIDRYRVKRNRAIYQPVTFISKSETEGILETAKEYWHSVKKYLKEKNPQLELFDF
ncbi:MAG: hypothetical protein COW72_00765 [Candidatus Nealsonbacteria bacterium CG18_big_fil_WC_8_21_14_2_50_37_10]|uniref:Uncharacterized protein n=1 Tax=Candidatus Nealsonbacteria bacterium CG18_big_fil_WC_8_21_14_2_50_37_10 TaxID=1974717 RepID=A0A2H0FKW1_9BACT|nr:MAG: hypothetical protein COW72_00765 [Candidatus Nealsonbacteria bacterium CG18_big_fil_WC_8_21_14_2_50_37_10]